MKFTLSWLKDYLETDASLEQIAETLTSIGLEVEGITDPAKDLQGFVVGEVVECGPHPDADKLQVTMVDTGTEKLQVVCGAPNCRLGLKGVFAPSGSYVPGLDITLGKAKIRGVESNGMLCSEKELCLSDEHKGIIDLPAETKIGTPAAAVLGLDDPVIEIALTPNRGDCAGIYGIARDLAAAGLGALKTPDTSPVAGSFDSSVTVSIKDDAKSACPCFIGRMIKGVKNAESPAWLQQRLTAIGLRPISALVDITNFFTIAFARPLHVYDADKLKGNIHVRLSKQGEKLDALDDKHYELSGGMAAICDDSGVLGLGGIIGGEPSSVSETTENVYLECALFDPVAIAATGRALQIDSDARYRFERGVDPGFAEAGAELATKMILELCGGEASKTCVAGAAKAPEKTVKYDPALCEKLGGLALPEARQKEILEALGFTISKDWTVTAPSWRPDIDGKADIVEEVLRIHGYDKIEDVALEANDNLPPPLSPLQKKLSVTRRILAGRGLSETVTWAFMSSKTADLFGAALHQNKAALTLSNPISSELDMMRPSLLPNLVDGAARNIARGHADIGLFEIANAYISTAKEGHVMTIAGIRSGDAAPRHWSGVHRPADVYDIKADALTALAACGAPVDKLQLTEDAPDWYHPGRSACLRLGPHVLAQFGEIHPAVLDDMDTGARVYGFEIFPERIPQPKKQGGTAREPLNASPFQPAYRDFAFLVDDTLPAEKLIRAIRNADKDLIAAVDIFDIYKGKGVPEDKKSVALYVTLQPREATLTDADFKAFTDKVVANVEKQTGGTLRG